MKKLYFKVIPLALAYGLLLTGCKKDNEVKKASVEFPTEFSDLTPEQNKTKLEDNGLELLGHITELKDSKGIQASMSFSSFMESENEEEMSSSEAARLMNVLSSFGKNKSSIRQVLTNMRVQEDETPQDMFNSIVGTHTWNPSTETWDSQDGTDKAIFKFPSTEAGTSNNATLTVHSFKTVNVSNGAGNLPTSLKADLAIDGSNELSYSFAASYNANGYPTSFNTSLTLGVFKLSAEASYTNANALALYSLTKGSQILIALGSNAAGDFSNLGAEDSAPSVTSAEAFFQLLNIKFAGKANVKELMAIDESKTIEERIAAINEHYKFIVFYADSKKKIADSEFYVVTNEYDEKEASMRLIFADGSKSDLENYVETGFEGIEAEVEKLMSDFTSGTK